MSKFDVEGYVASLETIQGRQDRLQAGGTPETYTEKLLADPNKRFKKLGEETLELACAACQPEPDAESVIGEAADTVYAVETVVTAAGLSFFAVLDELARRNKKPK